MEWESIVNQHSTTKKHNEHRTRSKKYLHRIIISCVVGLVVAFFTTFKLVHPVLGSCGLVASLMVACFNLGRVKESA